MVVPIGLRPPHDDREHRQRGGIRLVRVDDAVRERTLRRSGRGRRSSPDFSSPRESR